MKLMHVLCIDDSNISHLKRGQNIPRRDNDDINTIYTRKYFQVTTGVTQEANGRVYALWVQTQTHVAPRSTKQ